jgi:hypothetical protein
LRMNEQHLQEQIARSLEFPHMGEDERDGM